VTPFSLLLFAQASSSQPSQPAQGSGVADALIEAYAQRLSRSPRRHSQVSTAVCRPRC
jgi:hypothetical protein